MYISKVFLKWAQKKLKKKREDKLTVLEIETCLWNEYKAKNGYGSSSSSFLSPQNAFNWPRGTLFISYQSKIEIFLFHFFFF